MVYFNAFVGCVQVLAPQMMPWLKRISRPENVVLQQRSEPSPLTGDIVTKLAI